MWVPNTRQWKFHLQSSFSFSTLSISSCYSTKRIAFVNCKSQSHNVHIKEGWSQLGMRMISARIDVCIKKLIWDAGVIPSGCHADSIKFYGHWQMVGTGHLGLIRLRWGNVKIPDALIHQGICSATWDQCKSTDSHFNLGISNVHYQAGIEALVEGWGNLVSHWTCWWLVRGTSLASAMYCLNVVTVVTAEYCIGG